MAPPTNLVIRPATPIDLPAINDIYNYYVLQSTATYQEEPERLESRFEWFAAHGKEHPVTVAEIDAKIVGWGSLSAFHRRSAFRFTVENSVYLHHEVQGRGIGSALRADLIERAVAIGHRNIIAAIDGEQTASIGLHTKFGFTHAGRLIKAGQKFGRWLDMVYMQKQLPPHP